MMKLSGVQEEWLCWIEALQHKGWHERVDLVEEFGRDHIREAFIF